MKLLDYPVLWGGLIMFASLLILLFIIEYYEWRCEDRAKEIRRRINQAIEGDEKMSNKDDGFSLEKYQEWLKSTNVPAISSALESKVENVDHVIVAHEHIFKAGIVAGGKYIKSCIVRGCGFTQEITKDEFHAIK